MPKTPLFESRLAQQTAVTVALAVVFLGMAGLAALTTTRTAAAMPGSDATVRVPVTWKQLETIKEPGAAVARYGVASPDSATLTPVTLQAGTLRFSQSTEFDAAVNRFLTRFHDAPATASAEPIESSAGKGVRYRFTEEFVIRQRRGDRVAQKVHFVSLITPDGGRTYWVLHLTSLPVAGMSGPVSAELMAEMERSLRVVESG